MKVSSAARSRRTLVVPAAIATAVLSTVIAVPLIADAATKRTTPKLGAKCFESERGRTTNLLVCSKVGTKISWVKRKNPVTGGATTSGSGAAVIGGSTAGIPRPLDVIALVNGTGPAAASIKIDLTCTGLGGTPAEATQSASFSSQGGTQALNFNLLDPGTANPTGSSCAVQATVSGATPTLRILVDGRPTAGPAVTTLAAPPFVPRVRARSQCSSISAAARPPHPPARSSQRPRRPSPARRPQRSPVLRPLPPPRAARK